MCARVQEMWLPDRVLWHCRASHSGASDEMNRAPSQLGPLSLQILFSLKLTLIPLWAVEGRKNIVCVWREREREFRGKWPVQMMSFVAWGVSFCCGCSLLMSSRSQYKQLPPHWNCTCSYIQMKGVALNSPLLKLRGKPTYKQYMLLKLLNSHKLLKGNSSRRKNIWNGLKHWLFNVVGGPCARSMSPL